MVIYMQRNIDYFTSDSRFFIKSFLIDDSINANGWGVSRDAIKDSIRSAIGKPFVIDFDTFSHPTAERVDMLLREQEKYRVGTIIDVSYNDGYAWFIAEINDPRAIKAIKDGIVKFVSPSIIVDESNVARDSNGNEIINKFVVAHVAGVKEPAFGIIAQINAQCSGSRQTCLNMLRGFSNGFVRNSNHDDTNAGKYLHRESVMSYDINRGAALCHNECKTIKNNNSLCLNPMNANMMSTQEDNTINNRLVEYENTIAELKRKLRLAELSQVIDRIVTAKLALGKIDQGNMESEKARYAESDTDTLLEELASVYEEMLTNKSASLHIRRPYSADSTIYADKLFMR
jgi:hypothetical protein